MRIDKVCKYAGLEVHDDVFAWVDAGKVSISIVLDWHRFRFVVSRTHVYGRKCRDYFTLLIQWSTSIRK